MKSIQKSKDDQIKVIEINVIGPEPQWRGMLIELVLPSRKLRRSDKRCSNVAPLEYVRLESTNAISIGLLRSQSEADDNNHL